MSPDGQAAADGVVIDAKSLVKRFGAKTVVNGFSMRVKKGELYGFLGPNGSGKTTTIRMLCGLLKPDGGSGTCLGLDIEKDRERIKPQVGYMAQHFSLYKDLTVEENLDFIAQVYRVPQRTKAVAGIIDRLQLNPFVKQFAGTLSGGWQQRLALAACLIHNPRLLMLDEPTSGVDPKARRDFWDLLHQLTEEGITALISTHYMDEAERCHRLAYIAYGDLLASGTVGEIVDQEGLTTYNVTGGDIHRLAREISGLEGVAQVVPFGNSLHVSGHSSTKLEQIVANHQGKDHTWTPIPSSLEEAFISLMSRTRAK
jgi:ABC-2 type transport system ATP-binding protein